MKKYFILFLSVFLVLVCSCKKDVGPAKPSFSVTVEEDGLRIKISCAKKYVHGVVSVWDNTNSRYNFSVDTAGAGEVAYPFVKEGRNYQVKVELYEDNNGSWVNYYNVGWSDKILAVGGLGNYGASGNGLEYDAEAGTISVLNYNVYNETGKTGYSYARIWTTPNNYTWSNYKWYNGYAFDSWSNDINNMNNATGVATFDSVKNAAVIADLTGTYKNFWYRFYRAVYYNGVEYYWEYDPQIIMTYGQSSEKYKSGSNFIEVNNTSEGFIISKVQNYNYPNVRISIYNVTEDYECPRIVTDWPSKVIDYDYLKAGDVYNVKVQIWNENWGDYWDSTITGITAKGGKGNLGFTYSDVSYEQGNPSDLDAVLKLTDAEFLGGRNPESYTMTGNLWYNNGSNNIWYNNYGYSFDSESKVYTIDISSQLKTIRGKEFYPELVAEWGYKSATYQLTIIDNKNAKFQDNHVKSDIVLDKPYTVLPDYGTFTVDESLKSKKAYLIKYNKNSSKVDDKSIITANTNNNDVTIEETLAKSRAAALSAIRDGIVPELKRYEVDFVGYDFGEPIGDKVISRSATPLADYSNYEIDVTTNKFNEGTGTLKAIGEHCNVWYMNNNKLAHEVLTDSIAAGNTSFQTVADKFDSFYEYETYLIGSNVPTKEYWDIINIDNSVKIDIFIFDLYNDYKGQRGGTYGYFWAKDMVIKSQNKNSNEREMIYIDSAFLGQDPVYMYATLAHEFQHLLLYVNKWLNRKLDFPSWYTEMMSLGMEDIMQVKVLGYNNNEAINNRVYNFNGGYNAGFVDWGGMNDSVYYSYSNAAIFMDYLLKNYGGVDLYYEIAQNDYIGADSITKALQKLGYDETFDTVMMKMGQIIVNAFPATLPADALTVNKTASSTLNINGKNVTFNFNKLDLKYFSASDTGAYTNEDRYLNYSFEYTGDDGKAYTYKYGGPSVLKPGKNFKNIYANAITVNLISETPDTIIIDNPGDGIEMAVLLCDVYNK